MRAAAAPSAPAWQQRWEQAVDALGLPLFRMPSGAGHDAMKLHEVMPQAMLFVRGINSGISHNPLESSTNDDIAAVQCRPSSCCWTTSPPNKPTDRRRTTMTDYAKLDAWIDAHFDEEVRFLQATGAGAHRHAAGQQRAARRAHRRAAEGFGFDAEKHAGARAGSEGLRPANRSPT